MYDIVSSNDKIVINVSGMRFETWPLTLSRFPNTLLGNPYKRRKYFDFIHNEYFFERHRQSFESILYYYQSNGRFLIRPLSVSSEVFFDEIVFFQLGQEVINKYKKDEGYLLETESVFMPRNRYQRIVWLLFENPRSSILARIIAVISVCIITISIAMFCIETLPEVKAMRANSNYLTTQTTTSTILTKTTTSTSLTSITSATKTPDSLSLLPISSTISSHTTQLVSNSKDIFFIIETICIIWFTFELIMRFIAAPKKIIFIKQLGNIIDLFSILPYFLQSSDASAKFSILRIIRLVRVFRIFKLARHFKGLQILAHTLRASANELTLLMFFILIGVILFSSMVYFVELDHSKSDFSSIPEGFWYVIITMTTVGYGDMYPKTIMGRLVGSFCAIAGVLTIALPVPIIVSHFQFFYQSNQVVKKLNKETLIASCEMQNESEHDKYEENKSNLEYIDTNTEKSRKRRILKCFNFNRKKKIDHL